MSDAFISWLDTELKQRSWSQRELARRSGLSQSIISRTMAGKVTTTANFAVGIAIAFDMPTERVLRLAGILPALPEADEALAAELVEIAKTLPADKQQQLLEFARFLRRGGQ